MVDGPHGTAATGGRGGGHPAPRPRFHSDFLVALVVLVFCAATFYLTTTFEEVPSSLAQGMQPAAFPRLVLVVILGLSAIMVLQALGKRGKGRKRVPVMVYLTTLAMIAFLLINRWIDLFVAIVAFCLAVPLLWRERRYLLVIAYAILLPVGIFVLFSMILEVRFPRGVITNLLY